MALEDITPKMTSNTEPAPHVASSSTQYSDYHPYLAFNKMAGGRYWCTTVSGASFDEFIMLDFGKKIISNAIKIVMYSNVSNWSNYYLPTDFSIEASIDGNMWSVLKNVSGLKYNDKDDGDIIVEFENSKAYRYYKIRLFAGGSGGYVGIQDVRFMFDSDKISSGNKLSIHKTLKENLPQTIKSGEKQIHFTEDGEIYISKKDGKLMKCYSNIVASVGLDKKEW